MRDQFLCWTNRTFDQFSAAVWAFAAGQSIFHAIAAERALIGADPRIGSIWRKIFIAAFAVRSKRQHRHCPLVSQLHSKFNALRQLVDDV